MKYTSNNKSLKYCQKRTLFGIMICYIVYYLTRQNFSFVIPQICNEFRISTIEIGRVMSISAILYGLSKCIFGFICDRYSSRLIMCMGLFSSGIANIFLGVGTYLPLIFLFFILNQCFQSMGSPSCSKILTHWFAPNERSTAYGLWNASAVMGKLAIAIIAPILINHFGWHYVFYLPGIIAIVVSVSLFPKLHNSPQSLGFSAIEKNNNENKKLQKIQNDSNNNEKITIVNTIKLIFEGKYIAILGIINLLLYINEKMFLNWGAVLFSQIHTGGASRMDTSYQMVIFEFASIIGVITMGYISDKFFNNRRAIPGIICTLSSAILCFIFITKHGNSIITNAICVFSFGFFLNTPLSLINAFVSETVDKRVVATAIGFIGTMGYVGSAVAGVGTARVAEKFGWTAVIVGTMIISLTATGLFYFLQYKQFRNKNENL